MGIYLICGSEFYISFKDGSRPKAINGSGNCFCVGVRGCEWVGVWVSGCVGVWLNAVTQNVQEN